MFCVKCGKTIPEGAHFCGYCGTPVQTKPVCPSCGREVPPDTVYCNYCGQLLSAPPEPEKPKEDIRRRPVPDPGPVPDITGESRVKPQGQLLRSMQMVSLYEGTPTVGIAKATGKLFIYDDRIEFIKQFGNSAANMMGLVGMMSAAKKAQDELFRPGDVSTLRIGKYGGVYNTLVVSTKAGRTVSFCPGMPGSRAPEEIIRMLSQYAGWNL